MGIGSKGLLGGRVGNDLFLARVDERGPHLLVLQVDWWINYTACISFQVFFLSSHCRVWAIMLEVFLKLFGCVQPTFAHFRVASITASFASVFELLCRLWQFLLLLLNTSEALSELSRMVQCSKTLYRWSTVKLRLRLSLSVFQSKYFFPRSWRPSLPFVALVAHAGALQFSSTNRWDYNIFRLCFRRSSTLLHTLSRYYTAVSLVKVSRSHGHLEIIRSVTSVSLYPNDTLTFLFTGDCFWRRLRLFFYWRQFITLVRCFKCNDLRFKFVLIGQFRSLPVIVRNRSQVNLSRVNWWILLNATLNFYCFFVLSA